METIICDIPVVFDPEQVAQFNNIKSGTRSYEKLASAESLFLQYAHPKAVLKWVEIKPGEGNQTWVDETLFESIIISEKLKAVEKAFVFVASAGHEILDALESESLILKESLAMYSLILAHTYVRDFLSENFGYTEPGFLNPGSLPDWPIVNNFALFDILGPATEQIGVQIMDTGYMNPWKSSSGIIFSDAGGYQNCILCKNLECIGRRAPFDEVEYARIFGSGD